MGSSCKVIYGERQRCGWGVEEQEGDEEKGEDAVLALP